VGAALAGSGLGGPANGGRQPDRPFSFPAGGAFTPQCTDRLSPPHEMIVQIQCVRFLLSEELLECQQGDECRARDGQLWHVKVFWPCMLLVTCRRI
jgi:hypothetical protein